MYIVYCIFYISPTWIHPYIHTSIYYRVSIYTLSLDYR